MCFIHKNAPINRRMDSKFYVSYNELSTNSYPKYCDGPAYMFQGNLTEQLYEASLKTKFFKFEDVYFGLLAAKLKLNFIGLKFKYRYKYSKSFQIMEINQIFESNKTNHTFFIYPCNTNIFQFTWSKLITYFN